MREEKMEMGLLEQIRHADSISQVETLLGNGTGYFNATADTKRKWEKAAKIRTEYLKAK